MMAVKYYLIDITNKKLNIRNVSNQTKYEYNQKSSEKKIRKKNASSHVRVIISMEHLYKNKTRK